jgi:hypothetical protein
MKQSDIPFVPAGMAALFVWLWLLLPGCANIIPPTGGLKDTLPPMLLKVDPPNGTLGFDAQTITFQFNEYINIDDLQGELIINPPVDKQPEINAKLRTLTIKIKDTLQPNTTYSYRFGQALKDLNEGNPLPDFSYVVSTGKYVDSLMLAGAVLDAETGLPDSTLMVLLYRSADDSAVAKEKARFMTRVNGRGQFLFENLPPGNFYVYALKDEGIRRYTSPRSIFAFLGNPVPSGLYTDSVRLRAFVAEKEDPNKKPAISDDANATQKKEVKILKITPGASVGQSQDLLSPFGLQFSVPIQSFDSTKLFFSDTNQVPIRNFTLQLDSTAMRLQLSHAWKDGAYYQLIIGKNFALDSMGKGNTRADTVLFKTRSESEYGAVKLQFNGLDMSKHPVLQWVENSTVVMSVPLTANRLAMPLVKPSEYKLRLLYDANKNGKWDTGDYWKKLQPEMIIAIPQKISVRANWDNEYEIDL